MSAHLRRPVLSISQSVRRNLSTCTAPVRRGLHCTILFVGPSANYSFCVLYQSAPSWRLFTALSTSRPLRGGFMLHFLSVGPSMEALYCTFYQSAPRGGFILHFMLAGPSVEVLYCTFYYSALSASYFTFYQSVPSWRPCTTLPSVGLCRGFVLYSVAVRHDDEKICPRETLFTHHFGPLC